MSEVRSPFFHFVDDILKEFETENGAAADYIMIFSDYLQDRGDVRYRLLNNLIACHGYGVGRSDFLNSLGYFCWNCYSPTMSGSGTLFWGRPGKPVAEPVISNINCKHCRGLGFVISDEIRKVT